MVFNLVTAVAALILLPVLLALVAWMTDVLALDPSAATTLAAFHTTFNLFGVLLMWPLSMRLERLLLARFRTADEDEGRPRHLDANALTVPALALDALVLETRRVGAIARRMVLMALDGATPAALTRQQAVFDRLTRTVAGFVVNIHRNVMSASSGERLSRVLRELRYYDTIARMAGPIAAGLDGPQFSGSVRQHHERFRAGVRAWIDVALPGDEHQVLPAVAALPDSLMIDYALLKDAILRAAAMEELDIERMDAALEGARAMRQAAEQAFKALSLLHRIESSGGSAGIDEARKDLLSE